MYNTYPSTRKLLLATDKNHNQSKCRLWSPVPMDTSPKEFQHLRLGENYGSGGRKTVRVRRSGSWL